jgi:sarcosine oxidase subunit delta
MKIMVCPLNGPRNISEFVYGGEAEWADYVFYSDNNIGVVREWWLHAATSFWFIADRHTGTDNVVRTYYASEIFNERVEFAPKPEKAES